MDEPPLPRRVLMDKKESWRMIAEMRTDKKLRPLFPRKNRPLARARHVASGLL